MEFDSNFESGNLAAAIKVSETEYDLVLQNDTNTQGYIQWFFYKVRAPKTQKYTFNILNHTKSNSLFNYGMRVLVSQEEPDGFFKWKRGCSEIQYRQNNFKREHTCRSRYYYQLTFSCELEANKPLYFAYCYPYTATQLSRDLSTLVEKSPHVQRSLLCKTLGGNRCEVVTITEADASPSEKAKRKGVMFTARIHPGESNSSFVMKGIMEYLALDESPEA